MHPGHKDCFPVTALMNDKPDKVDAAAQPETGGELVEPAEGAVQRLEGQVAELTDRHLRLAAEYDNFRKRTIKERGESWIKAQADMLARLVDALDDLTRFGHADLTQTDAKTLRDAIDLVERKVWKELEALGVSRINQAGVQFDPQVHEAVSTKPAANPSQDHTVGAVLQSGYRLKDLLIRPARVEVLTWRGEAG